MSEYAPGAIMSLFSHTQQIAPDLGLQLGGVLGDASHTYGYHRARAVLASDDYSVEQADDKLGDTWAASALDLTPSTQTGQRLMTQRLIDATAKNDPRLLPIREFFGSVDGANVTGRDVRGHYAVTSDSSHLWHVHLSIYRRYATSAAALLPVAQVIAGIDPADTTVTGDPVPDQEEEPMIAFQFRDGTGISIADGLLKSKRSFETPADLAAWTAAFRGQGGKIGTLSLSDKQASSIPLAK